VRGASASSTGKEMCKTIWVFSLFKSVSTVSRKKLIAFGSLFRRRFIVCQLFAIGSWKVGKHFVVILRVILFHQSLVFSLCKSFSTVSIACSSGQFFRYRDFGTGFFGSRLYYMVSEICPAIVVVFTIYLQNNS
jgi:hypothetical protein